MVLRKASEAHAGDDSRQIPHKDVASNVDSGLRQHESPDQRAAQRVHDLFLEEIRSLTSGAFSGSLAYKFLLSICLRFCILGQGEFAPEVIRGAAIKAVVVFATLDVT